MQRKNDGSCLKLDQYNGRDAAQRIAQATRYERGRRRHSTGGIPISFLKARLNAASDS